jgi:hypothetical protein
MKPCCVWKCSGATTVGTCSSLTLYSTLQETEMRTLSAIPAKTLFTRGLGCIDFMKPPQLFIN